MNESKDIKQLEGIYGLLKENEDNKVWKSGDCPEALGDSPLAHDLEPESNAPEQVEDAIDSKDADKDNEYYLKKISERTDKKQEKQEKSVQEHINNSTTMSNNEPENIFDKLYSTIMEGEDPFAELDGIGDDAEADDIGGDEELDLGGDEITLKLPRDLAEQLHDALMSQLGGEDQEADDLGDELGDDDEGEDEMLGDAVVSEPEPKALADGKAKLQGSDNKVGTKGAESGKADGGSVKEDPEPKPLADGKGKLQGHDNKVHNPKSKGLGD